MHVLASRAVSQGFGQQGSQSVRVLANRAVSQSEFWPAGQSGSQGFGQQGSQSVRVLASRAVREHKAHSLKSPDVSQPVNQLVRQSVS